MPIYNLEQNYFISHEKKEGNLKHVIHFMKKKVKLGVLGVSPFVSNGVPQPYLDTFCFFHCGHAIAKLLIVHSKCVFCLTYLYIMEF
jgi:hypothetical protein